MSQEYRGAEREVRRSARSNAIRADRSDRSAGELIATPNTVARVVRAHAPVELSAARAAPAEVQLSGLPTTTEKTQLGRHRAVAPVVVLPFGSRR